MIIDPFILVTAIIVLIVLVKLYSLTKIKSSHRWRKESAAKVLKKVRSFESDAAIFNYIRQIDPFVFEELILTALDEREDIKVIRNNKYTGDGGIDGRFILNKQLYLIQAKRYSNHINHNHLDTFHHQIEKEQAIKGYFIHTGKTGKTSYNKINRYSNIDLVSGQKLIQLIKYSKI